MIALSKNISKIGGKYDQTYYWCRGLLESLAQQLKPKAQLSLSPKLSSRLSLKAQVWLSSVGPVLSFALLKHLVYDPFWTKCLQWIEYPGIWIGTFTTKLMVSKTRSLCWYWRISREESSMLRESIIMSHKQVSCSQEVWHMAKVGGSYEKDPL